jgi:hypothetical protein
MAFVGPTPLGWVWRPGRPVTPETMDDREANTYSTPEDAGWQPDEAREATERMAHGLPLLFGSVFVAVVVVAVVVLAVRYLL